MTTIPRADVVLSHVAPAWLRTVEIAIELDRAGYLWSAQTVLGLLHALHEAGRIERRQIGRAYEWRTVPAPEVRGAPAGSAHGAPDLRDDDGNVPPAPTPDAEAILAELRSVIDRAQRPADALPSGPITVSELDARAAAHPTENLLDLADAMLLRIVKRAAYDALKAVADVLDGWLETSRENHEGMHRDRFEDCCGRIAPSDVLDMIDAAAEGLGVRKLPRKAEAPK